MTTPASTEPYEDDFSYLEAEMEWVDTRCRRLLCERMIRGTELELGDEGYRKNDIDPGSLRERQHLLHATEQQRRDDIDARVAASVATGTPPVLTRMHEACELTDLERATLLLAIGVQLRPDFDDHYRRLGESAYLSVRSVFEFAKLSLRDRAQQRHLFIEEGNLSVLGLVEIRAGTPEPTLEDVLNALVVLQPKGFELLLGETSMEAEVQEEAEAEVEEHAEPEPRRRRRQRRDREQDGAASVAAPVPDFRLAELVLPAKLMAEVEELVAAARGRQQVLQAWGIARHVTYGTSVTAIFHGPPGTGKTHAALAVAGQLGRPLVKVRAPELISKWMGESQRNVACLFRHAQQEDAVLFLDEADMFIAQRGMGLAHPHDEALTNVLLQLIEKHQGVVLMATNLMAKMDTALTRRLSYQLHFPHPGPAERARIWQLLIPDEAPVNGGLDLVDLGARWEMTGALIKNAVVKACFRAARAGKHLTQALLVAAAAEEVAAQAGASGSNRVRGVGFR